MPSRSPYRREEILRVAVDLFHRQGVAHTSMQSIAGAVGIRTPSLYHHFRDRAALVDAAIDRAQAEIASRIARVRQESDPEAHLEALVGALVDHVVDDFALAAVGRHDRPYASSDVRRRAERTDAALLATIAEISARLRPGRPAAAHPAVARALVTAIWSITHADLRLDAEGLRSYLRRAALAVVVGANRGARPDRSGRAAPANRRAVARRRNPPR